MAGLVGYDSASDEEGAKQQNAQGTDFEDQWAEFEAIIRQEDAVAAEASSADVITYPSVVTEPPAAAEGASDGASGEMSESEEEEEGSDESDETSSEESGAEDGDYSPSAGISPLRLLEKEEAPTSATVAASSNEETQAGEKPRSSSHKHRTHHSSSRHRHSSSSHHKHRRHRSRSGSAERRHHGSSRREERHRHSTGERRSGGPEEKRRSVEDTRRVEEPRRGEERRVGEKRRGEREDSRDKVDRKLPSEHKKRLEKSERRDDTRREEPKRRSRSPRGSPPRRRRTPDRSEERGGRPARRRGGRGDRGSWRGGRPQQHRGGAGEGLPLNTGRGGHMTQMDYARKRLERVVKLGNKAAESILNELRSKPDLVSRLDGAEEELRPETLLHDIDTTEMTDQEILTHAMMAYKKKTEQLTGVTLPKFYNVTAMNPIKYAELEQKKKLLWGKAAENKSSNESLWQTNSAALGGTQKAGKFQKLMGLKHVDPTVAEQGEAGEEFKQKQDQLFAELGREYDMGRRNTHIARGSGLGFGSHFQPQQQPGPSGSAGPS